MDEAEEVKRFEKALGKCRTCEHINMSHTFHRKQGICIEAILTNKEVYKACDCKLFIPTDNLEYLEWAAERKEKGK